MSMSETMSFSALFKKLRLRSAIATLSELADILSIKGYMLDESLFSRWQRGSRTPKNRQLLLTLLTIFAEREGLKSISEANLFLELAQQTPLNEDESATLLTKRRDRVKPIPSEKLLRFFQTTAKSKELIRTGWKRERIHNPESVAEHSFQLSIMAMIFADRLGVDTEKLIKMAIVHDLGELVTGDIVWTRGKIMDIEKRVVKEKAELDGIINIFGIIDKAGEFKNIFEEMIERRSPEARIFWQLDKLEMTIQALKYEEDSGKDLGEFFLNSDLQIFHPLLRQLFSSVIEKRPKFS